MPGLGNRGLAPLYRLFNDWVTSHKVPGIPDSLLTRRGTREARQDNAETTKSYWFGSNTTYLIGNVGTRQDGGDSSYSWTLTSFSTSVFRIVGTSGDYEASRSLHFRTLWTSKATGDCQAAIGDMEWRKTYISPTAGVVTAGTRVRVIEESELG